MRAPCHFHLHPPVKFLCILARPVNRTPLHGTTSIPSPFRSAPDATSILPTSSIIEKSTSHSLSSHTYSSIIDSSSVHSLTPCTIHTTTVAFDLHFCFFETSSAPSCPISHANFLEAPAQITESLAIRKVCLSCISGDDKDGLPTNKATTESQPKSRGEPAASDQPPTPKIDDVRKRPQPRRSRLQRTKGRCCHWRLYTRN